MIPNLNLKLQNKSPRSRIHPHSSISVGYTSGVPQFRFYHLAEFLQLSILKMAELTYVLNHLLINFPVKTSFSVFNLTTYNPSATFTMLKLLV